MTVMPPATRTLSRLSVPHSVVLVITGTLVVIDSQVRSPRH